MRPAATPRVLLLAVALLVCSLAAASARRRGGGRPASSATSGDGGGEDAEDLDDDALQSADVGEPLMLTPLLDAGRAEEARNASRTDPPMLDGLESYSGYLTVDAARDANLFFWFFPAVAGMADAPLVVWLQGGPGSSALRGVFLEHGPVKVKKGWRVAPRRSAWTRAASMLYVDSPAGTGFSYGDMVASSDEAARDLLVALRQFYALFPQLRANELFVAGESYGGKFAPALAMAIYAANTNGETTTTTSDAAAAASAYYTGKINLKGVAVGNPMADPESMLAYGDYLYQLGLVDGAGLRRFKEREAMIGQLIAQQRWEDAWRERDALVGRASRPGRNDTLFRELTGFRHRFNYLHSRDYLEKRSFKKLIRRAAVRRQLHVGNATYHNSSAVHEAMRHDVMRSARPLYEQLVEHYDLLLYAGQLDVADPYPLMVNFIERMQWSGADAYRAAERRRWMVDGQIAGYAKTAGRLTEVLVRNAGHMVPADQPKWALDLISKFVSHAPIASKK